MGALSPAPRTILFIHSGHDWIRGSERVLLDLATHISPAGYRPLVWCDSAALRDACRSAGLDIVDLRFPPHVNQPWWRAPPPYISETVSLIRTTQARLLHVNTLDCLPWSLRAARVARIPVIAHLHVPTTEEERIWSGLHQVTVAVGVSRFSLSWVESDGFDLAATRLIYNAVFPERLETGDATRLRAELGIRSSAFVVVTVGSLIPRKDIATVIQGVGRAAGSVPDLHLLILGSGEERASLKSEAAIAGVSDRVHFLGDRPDVGAILRDAADLLISAAREETLGLNVIEAGYFGLPSIVSDIPPHREIVGDDPNQVFEPGSAEDLARKIGQLGCAPGLRHQLGEATSRRVRERFTPGRFMQEFARLYDELLALPPQRLGWLHGFRLPKCYWLYAWTRLRGPATPKATKT